MSDNARFLRNRIHNSSNPYQGKFKKVLCVCSAGLLRSPTTAVVLSQEPYNFNTRAAGIVQSYALVPVDEVLLGWADEIVCMTSDQKEELEEKLENLKLYKKPPVICLNIEDSFAYRDPALVEAIKVAYDASQKEPSDETKPSDSGD